MKKSEIFNLLMDKICDVCEVRKESIIGGAKYQTVVDAKVLLVQYLRRLGLTNDEIALIMLRMKEDDMNYFPSVEEVKRKAKGIDNLFKIYSERCIQSRAFGLMSIEIRDFCAQTFDDMYYIGMNQKPKQ